MGSLKKYYFGKSKKKYGDQFIFSTYKINASAVYPAQIRNSSASLLDVGFNMSGVIDTPTITAHAGGSAAEFSRLYDQINKVGYVSIEQAVGTANARPLSTDVSFIGVNYLRDTAQNAGLYKYGDLPLAMDKDYVVNYIFRNETNGSNQRLNFLIRTDKIGNQGILVVGIRPAAGSYIIDVKYVYANRNLTAPDRAYAVSISDSTTNFTLFTFSYIQGVFRMYRNGTEIVATTTVSSLIVGTKGIIIGIGSSDMSSFPSNPATFGGKINDFKTLSLYTGENLTSFDITTYMNTYKTIHGIS